MNLVGHVMMTQALFPFLIAASKANKKFEKDGGVKMLDPRVVNLSARVGSISDNG